MSRPAPVDPTDPVDSIREFAGDDAGAVALRDGIGQLAEHYAGTPLGDRLAAVLAGRAGMRDLAGDAEFVDLTTAFTQRFSDEWDSLDPEQRAALVDQGDTLLAGLEPAPEAGPGTAPGGPPRP
ncbi:hypothetical protein [Nocardioides plantarum]|uniref:Uncharacterized protein n=1 Tax=Nocardioides plantarum TaxID=29299 RepID=A0ABV5K951_9ACTN|nr:hypothetical protein [Nocardioides plantarum]